MSFVPLIVIILVLRLEPCCAHYGDSVELILHLRGMNEEYDHMVNGWTVGEYLVVVDRIISFALSTSINDC